MTPADLARYSAISFECKKDSLRQNQTGDWKIAFTVQGLDMDERLTKAFPGTRYMAVLVEVGDDEMPVSKQPEKEDKPNPSSESISATPSLSLDKPAEKAKRDWRDIPPAAQASMLCDKPAFQAFLREKYPDEWHESMTDPDECVRLICAVSSKSELNDGPHRVIWHQLQSHYSAWQALAE